uniref:DNA topoisomerase n=1 Tax=Panagrolaimus davidi TaxID=227884 RepID=A0A914PUS1_9BILA
MFHGYKANVRMTSTLGHIQKLDFGPEVTRNQTEELFEADVVTSEANPEKRIPKMLAEVAKGADACILWLDCDLEGEAICFEVIDCVKKVMMKPPSNNVMDVIYRAKFSSSDEAVTAINNLVKPNFRFHLAAFAKHDLDLRVGVPFSRYQTLLLRDEQQCKVVSVERKIHIKDPPKALNTVELLKDASKHYNIGPNETMQAAEFLYTSGLISYPRTETTKYPKTVNLQEKKKKLRQIFSSFPAISAGGKRAESGDNEEAMDWEAVVEKEDVFERGEDFGDHCPIVPTGKPVTRSLSGVQKLIYELVCRRFFASWMPEQRYHTVDTVFSAGDVTFKRRIQEIDDYGFAKILPWEKAKLTRDVPAGIIVNGSKIKIKGIKISNTKSTAPSLISEAELIEKMEKHSIGTDASISSHIANIQRRNYVKVNEETRTLMPTKLGIQLIKAYRECIPALVETSLRAEFEKQIMRIAKGEREFEDARRSILDAFKEQFKIFRNNFHKFTKNFESCFEMKTEGTYGRNGYRNNQNNYNQQPSSSSSSSSINNRKVIHASRPNNNTGQEVRAVVKPNKPISQYPLQKPFPVALDRRETYAPTDAPKGLPVKRSLARVESFEESIKRLRL